MDYKEDWVDTDCLFIVGVCVHVRVSWASAHQVRGEYVNKENNPSDLY